METPITRYASVPQRGSEDVDVDIQALAFELSDMDNNQNLDLPRGTPYGSAFALPQIARSAKYNSVFVVLGIKSLLNVYLAMFIQIFLLNYIGEASQIMN